MTFCNLKVKPWPINKLKVICIDVWPSAVRGLPNALVRWFSSHKGYRVLICLLLVFFMVRLNTSGRNKNLKGVLTLEHSIQPPPKKNKWL